MEYWEFLPYRSVGPIRFEDTKDIIDKKVGESKRTIFCKNEKVVSCDYDCMSVDYDIKKQTIETIGIFPQICDLTITYNGINITQKDYKLTLSQLISLHCNIYFTFGFFFVREIGIGFYVSDDYLSDITIYSKNYADDWWSENQEDCKLITLNDLT